MNKQSSRTSLFLIELVLSIFFFIIAVTVCLQLFVKTFFLSQETVEINQAVLWSQNLAEPFLGSKGDYSAIKSLYYEYDCISELSVTSENHLLLCFDQAWNRVKSLSDGTYVVFSVFHSDESFAYQNIYIAKRPELLYSNLSSEKMAELLCQKDYQIYQLHVKKFIP